MSGGCSGRFSVKEYMDFSLYIDEKIPSDEIKWLKSGPQSQLTERIVDIANKLRGRNRRESLYNGMEYIWHSFSYDEWLNSMAFQRTADELFSDRSLGGCSDFALVQITLFRALGIPSRMIITANVDWMIQYQPNPLIMSEGHSFIEVFLEDRWQLLDTTYRYIYSEYDARNPSLPHGEYFCDQGLDFWDMGIKDISDLNNVLGIVAKSYRGDYEAPVYPKNPI